MVRTALVGRRERKKEATRQAIEDAAWALFGEKGYGRTTIEDITERVDVAARTFFRYFPSKEAVLFGDPRALEESFRHAFLARPADEDAFIALRNALGELAALIESQRDRHLLRHRILQAQGGRPIEDHFGAITEKGRVLRDVIAERLGTSDADPRTELLAGTAITIMDVAYRQWIATGATADIAHLVEATSDAFAQLVSASQS